MTTDKTMQTVGPIENNPLYRIFFPEACGLPETMRQEKVTAAIEALSVDASNPFLGRERAVQLELFSQYIHLYRQDIAMDIIQTTQSATFTKKQVDLLAEANRDLQSINTALQTACHFAHETSNYAYNLIRLNGTAGIEHSMRIEAANAHCYDLRRCESHLAEELKPLINQGKDLAEITPKPAPIRAFTQLSARLSRPGA